MTTSGPLFTGRTVLMVRRMVTSAVFVIAVLTFAFGFGNGWQLGLALGVPGWIAPLVAPAVDLSVIALLVSVQYLRTRGTGERLMGPRLLLVACGLITFALNTARAVLAGQIGRACFDAVAPLLLIGWSEVGPRLLALLHSAIPEDRTARTDGAKVVPDGQHGVQDGAGPSRFVPVTAAGPSPELLARARQLDTEQQARVGRPITRDLLREELRVSNATAGELLRRIRAPPKMPGSWRGT